MFFHIFIFFIINYQFYAASPWMNYTSLLSLEGIKLIAIFNLIFHILFFFEIIYDIF